MSSSRTSATPITKQEWLRNVTAFLRATRVAGVYIDDVVADARAWSVGAVAPRSTRRRLRVESARATRE
jgi:hypothetical protein